VDTGARTKAAASLEDGLRNGSFESGLGPWTVAGKGTLASDPARGRVLQAVASAANTTVAQPVTIDVRESSGATLRLAYKVASGEGRVRVLVAFDDAGARTRTSSLEVTAGDVPGDWTSWSGDLLALRPRPATLKEIRIVVEGGTVLLDDVALERR
jgi:hypothetical protein